MNITSKLQYQQGMRIILLLLVCYISLCFSFKILTHSRRTNLYAKKITPTGDDSMDEYRKAVVNALQSQSSKDGEFGARDMLELIIKKWGVAYDVQLRKNTPFGEGSGNIYVNIMWRYFGQKSFPMDEREYLEHLEALCRYMKSIDRIDQFKQKVAESRKRPNSYFGYAVSIPLDVDPLTADSFFGELDEQS
jgi:hypothetical protein